MKQSRLRQIISEEIKNVLNESKSKKNLNELTNSLTDYRIVNSAVKTLEGVLKDLNKAETPQMDAENEIQDAIYLLKQQLHNN